MREDLTPLPLFPLRSVLFPNMLMALHVFEDRYRQMISHCLDEGSPFGVVLIRSGEEVGDEDVEPYLVGTAAEIRNVERLDDGRMNILCQGAGRFRIRRLDRDHAYLVGLVEALADEEWVGSAEDRRVLRLAQTSFRELADALTERLDFRVHVRLTVDPTALSFAMAGMLGIEQRDRQRLLEVTHPTERFEEMLPVIQSLIAQLHHTGIRESHYSEIRHWLQPN